MSNMTVQAFLQTPNTRRVGLIALALVASLAAGISPLVYESPVSPLAVGGVVVAFVISIALLQNPVWALYAAIFVVFLPAVRGPTPLAQFIDRMQLFLNRTVTLIALASWLLNVLAQRRRIVWTSTALLMMGFLVWGMITLSWAPNLSRGMEKLGQYVFRLILYLLLIANVINTRETLDGLMRILAVNGWMLVLAGAATALSGGYGPVGRLQVLGMDQNEFGVRMLATMPGILWQVTASPERQKMQKMVQSTIFMLSAIVLVALSGSRQSAVAWSITFLAFWFWKPTRLWGKLGLLILAVAVTIAPFVFSTVVRRFLEDEGGSLGGRLMIWQASWQVIRDRPWSGVGIGNAGPILISYLQRTSSYFRSRPEVDSHNPILQIWTETGTLGMLLYLSVLANAVWVFVRQYSQCTRAGARSLSAYFALVSCVFVGIMLWWSAGGGAALEPSYFLLLAYLLVPSHLNRGEVESRVHGGVLSSTGQ